MCYGFILNNILNMADINGLHGLKSGHLGKI